MLIITTDHTPIYAFTFHKKLLFTISWNHSVEDEQWEEVYLANDTNLQLDYTRFKTYGAGVPSSEGHKSYLQDGWIYMTEIKRSMTELIIRTNSITNHTLTINDNRYSLPKNQYVFQTKTMPRLKSFIILLIANNEVTRNE
ncbi:hypothetical protein BFG57_17170 [Bacillus solimangrovi]|uniref:DUF1850 domain-containing protein n=2 Tax=Bacillus solimangrovi TaxID=1305675 RepID=A0A1E5LD42_9BACI|nr:hypothetical protein BFG57_17170 [Bacillus solimangrovi]